MLCVTRQDDGQKAQMGFIQMYCSKTIRGATEYIQPTLHTCVAHVAYSGYYLILFFISGQR